MKNQYEKMKLIIYKLDVDDICTLSSDSGEVDSEEGETKYPIPGGWTNGV